MVSYDWSAQGPQSGSLVVCMMTAFDRTLLPPPDRVEGLTTCMRHAADKNLHLVAHIHLDDAIGTTWRNAVRLKLQCRCGEVA